MERLTVHGLARGEHLYDAVFERDEVLLVPVGKRPKEARGLTGALLLVLTYAAAAYTRVGIKRLPGATGYGLAGEDESLSRTRLRMQSVPFWELQRRPGVLRFPVPGVEASIISSEDIGMVELRGGCFGEPALFDALGDPPERFVRALKERGARVG